MIKATVRNGVARIAIGGAFALIVTGCATTPAAADFDLSTVTPGQILGALTDMDGIRASFTREELRLAHDCYDTKFADGCDAYGSNSVPYFHPLLLGCAYDASPQHPHNVNGYCPQVARELARAGNIAAAKAILLHAPGCHAFTVGGDPKALCFLGARTLSITSGGDFRGWLGAKVLTDEEMLALATDSFQYDHGDVAAAQYLADHGVNASVAAAMSERQAQQANNKEATREINAATDRAIAAKAASQDAFLGALASMPGAGDPNAILHAASQQATAMQAIGDTAAARRAMQYGSPPAQSGPAISQGASLNPTSAATPASTLGGSAGASTSGATSVPPRATACTDESNSIAGTAWQDTQVQFAVGSLTNMGYQPLYVHYTFAQNGRPDAAVAGAVTIQPGHSARGELAGIWAASVDNPPRIYWWAVLQSQEDQGHCAGPW